MGQPDPLKLEARMAALENAVLALTAMAEASERTHAALPAMIEKGMETAINRSVSDEEVMGKVWISAGKRLRKQARDQAGGWVLGFLFRGAGWLAAFAMLASFLGWIPAWKIMSTAKP